MRLRRNTTSVACRCGRRLRQLEADGLVVDEDAQRCRGHFRSDRADRGAIRTAVASRGEIFWRAIPRITDEQLLKAKLVLEQLENAYKGSDVTSWGHLNWEFTKASMLLPIAYKRSA